MIPLVGVLIKAGLPILGKALADKGAEWLEKKTGVDLSGMLDSEEISPEQLEVLREVELANKAALTAAIQAISVEEIKDADSARNLQVQTLRARESWLSANFVYILAAFWSVICSAYIAVITFSAIPEPNVRFADTILGFILGTAISSIFSYFFGTSRSSNAKDGVVSRMLDKLSENRDGRS